ncbi:MAG: hypothetical protein P1U58_14445 [Verrucomicrobiales bacterium]|nr:hypothetical protein [Verrucomicrobiales bacterium]
MKDHHSRLFIAREFEVGRISGDRPLHLVIDYDDAFVAYINGVEVARSANLDREYLDADVEGGHEAGEAEVFVIPDPRGILKPGTNLISIEGHNVRDSSSDFSLNPSLLLGTTVLVPEGAIWRYLAGADAGSRWFLRLPDLSPLPELPRAEESEWTIGVRLRGTSQPFIASDIKSGAFGETDDKVFHAVVDSLQPGMGYEYSLAVNDRVLKTGWFRTAPRIQHGPIEFVVGGDMGTTTGIPVCKVAGELNPMFALVGGDLAYGNGREAYKWFDWIDNWTEFVVGDRGREIPMIMGIGNHEMKGLRIREKDAPFYFSLFDLPTGESNFTVDFSDYMSIVLLDSNHAKRVESQTLWLGLQLNARKDRRHLFSIYHRPAWGTGIKRNLKDIQRHWTPLFEQFGVDCVFENDHHTYKRSHKITNGVRDDENGILHIGDGAWGAKLRPITPQMLKRVGADKYLAEWASVHHLVKVTARRDGTKIYEAVNAKGEIFDRFVDEDPAKSD